MGHPVLCSKDPMACTQLCRMTADVETKWLTLSRALAVALRRKSYLLSKISEILTSISWINEPIPGMFVLFRMHFSWWFQIWLWNLQNIDIFVNYCTFRLLTPALWWVLIKMNKIVVMQRGQHESILICLMGRLLIKSIACMVCTNTRF